MNLADWVIIAVIVASAMHAAAMGFFQEAFHIGGLIAGYLLAAWQYQRLGILLGTYLKSPWAADSAAFLIIFFAVTVAFGLAGRTARWVMKASGLRVVDRFLGGIAGDFTRRFDRCLRAGGHDVVHPVGEVAGGIGIGSVLPGRRTSRDLGGALGVTGAFLPGT